LSALIPVGSSSGIGGSSFFPSDVASAAYGELACAFSLATTYPSSPWTRPSAPSSQPSSSLLPPQELNVSESTESDESRTELLLHDLGVIVHPQINLDTFAGSLEISWVRSKLVLVFHQTAQSVTLLNLANVRNVSAESHSAHAIRVEIVLIVVIFLKCLPSARSRYCVVCHPLPRAFGIASMPCQGSHSVCKSPPLPAKTIGIAGPSSRSQRTFLSDQSACYIGCSSMTHLREQRDQLLSLLHLSSSQPVFCRFSVQESVLSI